MAGDVLFADDSASFVDLLSRWTDDNGYENVSFEQSLKSALEVLRRRKFKSCIMDNIFPREENDGISVLEEARKLNSAELLYLITGKPLQHDDRQRLEAIGARLVDKDTLSWETIQGLFKCDYQVGIAPTSELTFEDVGALRLETEKLENELEDKNSLLDLLVHDIVGDILAELGNMPDSEQTFLLVGERRLATAELQEEVRMKTPLGLKIISLHHRMFRQPK